MIEAPPQRDEDVPDPEPGEGRAASAFDYDSIKLPPPLQPPFRQIVFWSGFLCVGLASLGIVLPLLPTTPLLLVAAACFARTDPRFHRWLLTNRVFGPIIRDWQQHRCIPLRAKVATVIMVGLVGGSSVVFFVPLLPVQILVGVLLIGLLAWILSHPSVPPGTSDPVRSSNR